MIVFQIKNGWNSLLLLLFTNINTIYSLWYSFQMPPQKFLGAARHFFHFPSFILTLYWQPVWKVSIHADILLECAETLLEASLKDATLVQCAETVVETCLKYADFDPRAKCWDSSGRQLDTDPSVKFWDSSECQFERCRPTFQVTRL